MGRVLGSGPGLVANRIHGGGRLRPALSRAARHTELLAAALVAAPALVLYGRTLMPDVGFWDTAEFQAIGPVLGIAHPTGYPAFTMLAWVASIVFQPLGNEAFRANLLNAFLAAAAVGVVAAVVTRLTGRLAVGVATGLVFALSAETWAIGLRADPHALHLLLAAVLVYLLVVWHDRVRMAQRADRWLLAAAVTFGIALGNHGLTFLLAPGIAVFVLAAYPQILRRPKLIAACAGGLALTTVLIYLYLPLRSAMNPALDYADPQTWEGFRYLVFAEQFRGTFRAFPTMAEAFRTIGAETLSQLGLFAILAPAGVLLAAWRRPTLVLLLGLWFLVNWVFALGYLNADIGRYYLVPVLAAAILGGIGLGAIVEGVERVVSRRRMAEGRLLTVATGVILAIICVTPTLAALPGRYRIVDGSRDLAARTWLDAVSHALEPHAVVVSWWSYSTTLWYGQYVEGTRPDISVVDDSTIVQQHLGDVNAVIDSYLGVRPVYLIRLSSDLPNYEQRYTLTSVPGIVGGPVYRVEARLANR
ncbi:MAG TPA: DUF2723 domain-containing protein [Candidatus Limnocylindrales bacterium]|nr:DUF2723 domain-containing protein [Candidatus Limnocylindrales bacterium]